MAAALDPAALLCLCGVRGCSLAELHESAFVGSARGPKGNVVRRRRRARRP